MRWTAEGQLRDSTRRIPIFFQHNENESTIKIQTSISGSPSNQTGWTRRETWTGLWSGLSAGRDGNYTEDYSTVWGFPHIDSAAADCGAGELDNLKCICWVEHVWVSHVSVCSAMSSAYFLWSSSSPKHVRRRWNVFPSAMFQTDSDILLLLLRISQGTGPSIRQTAG